MTITVILQWFDFYSGILNEYLRMCTYLNEKYVLSYGQRLRNKVFSEISLKVFFSKAISFIETLLTRNPCNIPLNKGCKLTVYKTFRSCSGRLEFVDFMLDHMREKSSPVSSFCSHRYSCMINSWFFCSLLLLFLQITAKLSLGLTYFSPMFSWGMEMGHWAKMG